MLREVAEDRIHEHLGRITRLGHVADAVTLDADFLHCDVSESAACSGHRRSRNDIGHYGFDAPGRVARVGVEDAFDLRLRNGSVACDVTENVAGNTRSL